ncbi:TM2 domain-containing protein almondex-like [Camponotus floridanus]|uniref:TM2 domain-containing protein almondex-like n=1 Tax=Camponotus floridanus TaxID=104421 RepID=UPI000DC69ABB|nr:TM2 domain-containing protein almondex-like [Camponotus floridanus]XP_025267731.1 TM2 domain-containing protein almondex-like [Camponotus floridanus]
MRVVRINSRNVIFLFIALLSTSAEETHTGHDTLSAFTLKEANVNTTPAYSSKKEELTGLCGPSGIPCIELSGECLKCIFNYSCVYGAVYDAQCSVMEHGDCIRKKTFQKKYMCRYCYQTDHWEHQCHQKNSCSSVASPQQYYRTNCTVNDDVLCLGRRKFMKNLPCNWTVGYRWSTALIFSITLGGFGADRFYLGHWQEGIGKLFSFDRLGVWTLIDVILISMRYLGFADGSLYI